ncbi:MAG: branched-chain amino acid ABC transporter permease [Acidimicrobiia bacterium]|nr:MAG: branched-chain amino acid ABC transporter permease [Acidimicrobiia bacterium]
MTTEDFDTRSETSEVLGGGGGDRRVSSVMAFSAIVVTGIALALVPIWIGDSRTLMGVAVAGLLFACYAIAFNLIFGSTGQLFLAIGALAGVGAYASAIASDRLGVPFPIAMVLATGLAMLISAAFSWIAVRRSLDIIFTGIVTLTFSLAFDNVLLGQRDITGGETGIVIDAGSDTFLRRQIPPYYVFLALVLVYLVGYVLLHRSHIGWAFRALRDDEIAAELSGVDVARYRIYAGAIGGGMLGFAGALWAHVEGFISPATFTFVHVDVPVLVMVVFGGIGTLMGPVVGAAVFTYIGEVLASFAELRLVAEGALLIVLFLLFPGGVVRAVRSGASGLRRRFRMPNR